MGGDTGNDRGGVGLGAIILFVLVRALEHDIGGFFLLDRIAGLFVPVLQPPLVTAQLLVDLLRRLVDRLMRVLCFGMALDDQALHDVGHDIDGEAVVRPLAQGDLR